MTSKEWHDAFHRAATSLGLVSITAADWFTINNAEARGEDPNATAAGVLRARRERER